MKNKFAILSALTIAVFLISFTSGSKNDPWPVPDKFVKMANPVKKDAASIAEGKTLWIKHCQSCHGPSGLGNGTKAKDLKTAPGDFSKASVQSQTDGSLFYKTNEGRKDMPSFKKKITDADDVWSIVNYIRTLKK
jgi:mono/diheme cytochrome c family protein